MPSASSNRHRESFNDSVDVVDDVFYDKSRWVDIESSRSFCVLKLKIQLSFYSNSERKFSSSSSNDGSASAHARRHSLGTFNSIRNDRFCTTSFIDEAPQSIAPKAPTTDWRRTSRGKQKKKRLMMRISDLYLKCLSSLFTFRVYVETLEWIKFNWRWSNISFSYDLWMKKKKE